MESKGIIIAEKQSNVKCKTAGSFSFKRTTLLKLFPSSRFLKEQREANPFSFCLLFSKPSKEHREAEPFSFCILFLFSKEKVWRGAELFSFSLLFLLSKEKVRRLHFFASFRKNTAERNPFLFAYFFFLAKKKYGACVFGKLPKEHREAESFSFCVLFLFSKEKVWRGAEHFSFCILFLFSKETVWCLHFWQLPKEHREAESFSFCLLFLFSKEKVGFSKEKVGYWAAARAKAFLRTMK